MLKKIQTIFISGLVAFLPIALTGYVVVAGVQIMDNFLGQYLQNWLPPGYYFHGLGLLSIVLLIFLIGFLLNNFITGSFLTTLQNKLTDIPFIKVVYAPLRDLINLFSKGKSQTALKKVVLVKMSPTTTALGLVTREDFADLNLNFEVSKNLVTVFIPYSYGLGGITLLVEKSALQPVDLPIEKAMSLAITAWIKTDEPKDSAHLNENIQMKKFNG